MATTLKIWVFIILSIGLSSAKPLDSINHNVDSSLNRSLSEFHSGYKRWGDMLLPEDFFTNDSTRNAIPNPASRWSGATVPYVIDASLAANTASITSAMQDYHSKTCVRFVSRTLEVNYIRIFAGQGCYSYVGMINRGAQDVSLGQGCVYKGTIVHELGHAIGFYHEQNRSDRDDYLIIYLDNIQSGMASQFDKLQPSQNVLYTGFDTNSVMLYGNTAFSKDGKSLTMEAKTGVRLYEPYDKVGLSTSDAIRVNKLYNC